MVVGRLLARRLLRYRHRIALMMAPPRQPPSMRNEMVKTKSEPAARIRQLMENLQGGNASKEKKLPKQNHQRLRVERAPVADTSNERTAPNTSSEGGGGGDHWGRGGGGGGGNHNQIDSTRADSSQGSQRTRPKLDRVHLSSDGLHAIDDEEEGGEALPKVSSIEPDLGCDVFVILLPLAVCLSVHQRHFYFYLCFV